MAGRQVIVVGAGPAGVRAAETLVAAGLRPVVVDEGKRDGGQIYRRQPGSFKRTYVAIYGTEARRAADLHGVFDALRERIDYRPETLAWNVVDGRLHIVERQRSLSLQYDALIIASGAADRVMPLRGWNVPGVYSLGAAQIALKAQACAVGQNVAFVGTGPLLYLVAWQYLKSGGGVAGLFDTSHATHRARALPKLAARPATLLKGMALIAALRRRHVTIETGVVPLEILGDPDHGVQGLKIRTRSGHDHAISCDAVALGYHLRPETQLADLARCGFYFERSTHQWLPIVDDYGRTTVKGVYLAGDGARLLGADGAECMGRLAAFAVLADLGHGVEPAEVSRLRKSIKKMDRFRIGLAQAFRWPAHFAAGLPDDAVVCRCEAVTAGDIRAASRRDNTSEINRVKAFSRAGMGRCQGRYCGHATAEVIAAASNTPVEHVGRLRGQAPVKPLPIATIWSEE